MRREAIASRFISVMPVLQCTRVCGASCRLLDIQLSSVILMSRQGDDD
jgi:hypothetical protein